jgi:hypothetical protein
MRGLRQRCALQLCQRAPRLDADEHGRKRCATSDERQRQRQEMRVQHDNQIARGNPERLCQYRGNETEAVAVRRTELDGHAPEKLGVSAVLQRVHHDGVSCICSERRHDLPSKLGQAVATAKLRPYDNHATPVTHVSCL